MLRSDCLPSSKRKVIVGFDQSIFTVKNRSVTLHIHKTWDRDFIGDFSGILYSFHYSVLLSYDFLSSMRVSSGCLVQLRFQHRIKYLTAPLNLFCIFYNLTNRRVISPRQ